MVSHYPFKPEDHFPFGRHRITDPAAIYFLTLTVNGWIDVFTRVACRQIVLDSLDYCQERKGLALYAYVVMSNHVHLLARATHDTIGMSDILRDFKRHTSKKIHDWIRYSGDETRATWMLPYFASCAKDQLNSDPFQLWQPSNNPVICTSPKFVAQKFNYIHNNPVNAGIVDHPQEYRYSSARNYAGRTDYLLRVSLLEFH